jgi:hypothetical protein
MISHHRPEQLITIGARQRSGAKSPVALKKPIVPESSSLTVAAADVRLQGGTREPIAVYAFGARLSGGPW